MREEAVKKVLTAAQAEEQVQQEAVAAAEHARAQAESMASDAEWRAGEQAALCHESEKALEAALAEHAKLICARRSEVSVCRCGSRKEQ